MATLGQVYANPETRGEIKVNKTFLVPIERLKVKDGKNVREIDPDHVEYFAMCWEAGNPLPALTVKIINGEMEISDGHHRYFGAKLANDRGASIKRIECKEFTGDEGDEVAFMVNSSQGKPLTPIERAHAYQRLKGFGWTNEEIAGKVNRSMSDIQQHLSILNCAPGLLEKISNGEMSYAMAIEMQREHGDSAELKADEALDKAKSEGKKKITKSSVKSKFGAKQARRVTEIISETLDKSMIHSVAGQEVLFKLSTLEFEELKDLIEDFKGDKIKNNPTDIE